MFSGNASESLSESREELIQSLKNEGILKSKVIVDALIAIPREKFLWGGTPEFLAYSDEPQTLGETGQTISAPHMVVIMLEELDIRSGQKILEIGCGSGYEAALLGWIVSQGKAPREGNVVSVERNETLVEIATRKIVDLGLSKFVNVVLGDGTLGFPPGNKGELYDRIIVAAGARKVPSLLKSQLKSGGLLLIPVGGSSYQKLLRIRKKRSSEGSISYEEEGLVDCMFVPLIGQDQ
ncbi:MAG: protein-L-isoaspartate O-methyltransferase [Nitrososphaerota archaeon]|nr:protein-L-isoaspartate O-methyltransferase [Nitrososphaerota archaeon]